ncbi:peptidase inhibitor family I36 protein [Streptosporangium canum]
MFDRSSKKSFTNGGTLGKKLQMLALPIAALALATLTSVPAQAADGYNRCPDDHYCLFSGLDGTGDIIEIQSDTPDLAALNMAGRAKSDWNRTDSSIHLYSEAGYGGCSALTTPGGKGNFFITYRDFFNSVRIGGPNGPSCLTLSGSRADSHG